MGLIKAALGSAGGVLADEWREYFYCDSMDAQTLATKAEKRVSDSRSSNTKATENVITNGAVVAVNEGQAMMIVDQGKVVEFCAEPGEFTWDSSSQPSVFYGGLGEGLKKSFEQFGRRFGFGGDAGTDQRVYFFNLKEMVGNKYGTTSPVPFRVVDKNINLDIDTQVRCNGEYSFKMVDPMKFYVNICGNVEGAYKFDALESQMKSELLTALQPAFAKISEMGIRYSAVPGHTKEVCAALDEELTEKWTNLRGLKIVSFGCNSITLPEEMEKKIADLQSAASLGSNDAMRKGFMTEHLGDAMGAAAANEGGAMTGFMGVGMAMNTMGSGMGNMMEGSSAAANNYNVAADGGFGAASAGQAAGGAAGQAGAAAGAGAAAVAGAGGAGAAAGAGGGQAGAGQASAGGAQAGASAQDAWTCTCGTVNTGKFCNECGTKRPENNGSWKCTCGAENMGKFCGECGSPRP